MHQNSYDGRTPPGPAGGAHSAPPDPLADHGEPLRGREGNGQGRGVEGNEGRGRLRRRDGDRSEEIGPPGAPDRSTPLVPTVTSHWFTTREITQS
jgi:hypothetical protein